MNTTLLEIKVENLIKKYHNDYIFKNFNLVINNKKINLIIAHNGRGKSTFLKILLNLINYKGSIIMNFSEKSYCPDKVKLPDFIKVKDFIELIDLNKTKMYELLDAFNVPLNKKIYELSKGMKQKLMISQCIAKEANLYLFDEPINGLDEKSVKIFKNEINNIHKNNGLVIIVTHQISTFSDMNYSLIDLDYSYEHI